LIAMVRLPVSKEIKKPILESYWGREILPQTTFYEPQLRNILGNIPQEALLYIIPKAPKSDEMIKMTFPDNIKLVESPTDEEALFLLTNIERKARGISELLYDPSIVPVARLHSFDMFRRSYFSHVNLDGKSSFDRMSSGGVEYSAAGENLAYAPTVEIAHKGLMNSPGHKENILRREFGRIGIGVVDGGIYGKMYTQNFAD
ncbi:MAG: CAP domain-containing protein, partial [bacterium]|nr:CAP domain-containing protein [bacterium]